ncbi:DUF2735 domain-containing protein [Rhizobium cauense]|uniref:DUF2735 domain-containing protein n=1 Tax=Rhizobium cauense TaxID=1166683 RepID=UPI0005640499|nr:DUF2735 domain-containing protein [Rhizobium cauense]MBW9114093.1 DUF2735 domain-containing protein [Rhizobium cauense]
MAIGVHHGTATIYTFPKKRFAAVERSPKVDLERDMIPSVYESCWYHEEAMKEAETPATPKFKPRVVD